jgi:hypothetical protein
MKSPNALAVRQTSIGYQGHCKEADVDLLLRDNEAVWPPIPRSKGE